MKKEYEMPVAEIVDFKLSESIMALPDLNSGLGYNTSAEDWG